VTKYSISQSSRIAGKSRTTIKAHIKKGKLSAEEDANGNPVVDGAELFRLYGDDCDFERAEPPGKRSSAGKRAGGQPGDQNPTTDLKHLQDQLERETQERKREREQFEAQIDHLQGALKLAQEGQMKATLLLESRGDGVGDLQQKLRQLDARLDRQEENARREVEEIKTSAKRQIDKYKRQLEEERTKPLWQKLFS